MKQITTALALLGALLLGALLGVGYVVLRALKDMDELHESFGPGPDDSIEDWAAWFTLHGHEVDDG